MRTARILLLSIIAAVAGCSGNQSALDPQGAPAIHVEHLIIGITVICAVVWLLVMIVRLQPVPPIHGGLRLLATVGPFIFLAIGFAGFVLAGAFLAYPADYAKPLIVLAEAGLTLSIGVTLALLVAGPAERSS